MHLIQQMGVISLIRVRWSEPVRSLLKGFSAIAMFDLEALRPRPAKKTALLTTISVILHGVGADGVGVKFPIFAVNCCCLPLSMEKQR